MIGNYRYDFARSMLLCSVDGCADAGVIGL
jgi:hypothetical protein